MRLRAKRIEELNGPSQVWNHNGATDNQSNAKYFKELLARYAQLVALLKMIPYAIVTSQHQGSNETHHFFCPAVQRSIFVSVCIQVEEPLYNQIVLAEYPLIHLPSKIIEFIDAITHVDHTSRGFARSLTANLNPIEWS